MAMAMKDELIGLLRDRFSDHELEVPDGVWEHVNGQLAASASGEGLRETLQDKFQGHEVEVDPSVWSSISSQLGHGVAAGTSFGTVWIAAGITALAIMAGVFLWNHEETPASVITDPVGTVTRQPVGALSSSTKPTQGPTAPVAVPPAKPEPAPVKKDPAPRTSPAFTKQPVQQAPVTVETEVKDAPAADSSSPSGKENGPKTQTSTAGPKAPAVQDPKQEAAGAKTQGPEVPTPPAPAPTDPHGDLRNTAPETSVPPERIVNDPFEQTDPFDLFIPNVMTPNGDGVNDKLVISAGKHLKALVRIFAKNGSLIFQTADLSQQWDGLLPNGNIADEGYYKCIVQVTDLEGRPHLRTEVIRLYR
jgi:gliding motility-associated-like protein